jgi:hypothetical protein
MLYTFALFLNMYSANKKPLPDYALVGTFKQPVFLITLFF